MLWRKQLPDWPVDPERVEYGSVLLHGEPAVMVLYAGQERPHYLPVEVFCARTRRQLQAGRPLGIRLLRISPRTKRRYKSFFESLTDWSSATRRAIEAVHGPPRDLPYLGSG